MRVNLVNGGGAIKEVKIGFSWTTLFFGFFPALFRGDLKWAAIILVAAIAVSFFTAGLGAWLPGIVFSFIYNKIYIKELLAKGYRPADAQAQAALQQNGIIAA